MIVTKTVYCLKFFSYDEISKTMDPGFPKRVDESFSGMTGKVTAAFQYRGEYFPSKGYKTHLTRLS